MFDFHTHILPGVDDGSRNIVESLFMITELIRQGVSGIAATPHFYASRSTPEKFFSKRQAAWERLYPNLPPGTPEIRLGAEVQYFEGIQRMEGLERFRLEGTQLLLIEMPMCRWTTRMVDTVLELNSHEKITVLLAHIERYLGYRNWKALDQLQKDGVLMQASTGFFIERQRLAMKMLKKGKIQLLGTDAHNMEQRKPNFAQAIEIINRRKGTQFLGELIKKEGEVLK